MAAVFPSCYRTETACTRRVNRDVGTCPRQVELASDGAAISTELLVGLLGRGARLAELGVHHRPREAGRQSGTNPRVVARALRELIALRRRIGPVPEKARVELRPSTRAAADGG